MKLVFHAKDKKQSGLLRTYYHPSKDRSKRRLRVILSILFTVGFLFLLRGAYGLFLVRNVSCESETGGCGESDLKLTEHFSGRLIFGSFSLHSPGKTYSIKKKYPNAIQVMVKDIPIQYVLFTDEQKEHKIAISSDGVMYADTDKTGSFLASESATLIDLTVAANEQSVSVEKLTLYEKLTDFAKKNAVDLILITSREEIKLHIKPDLTAIVSSESIEGELRSLQLILSSSTIEAKPAVVDLRFDHPVLRYL